MAKGFNRPAGGGGAGGGMMQQLRRLQEQMEQMQAQLAEETARLPCFATGTPAPATTNAAVVETLNVPWPSPSVPQTSTERAAS